MSVTLELSPIKAAVDYLFQALQGVDWHVVRYWVSRDRDAAYLLAGFLKFYAEMEIDQGKSIVQLQPILPPVAASRHSGRGPIRIGKGVTSYPSAIAALIESIQWLQKECELKEVGECLRAVQGIMSDKSPNVIDNSIQMALCREWKQFSESDWGKEIAAQEEAFLETPWGKEISALRGLFSTDSPWVRGPFVYGVQSLAERFQRLGIEFDVLHSELELELAGIISASAIRPDTEQTKQPPQASFPPFLPATELAKLIGKNPAAVESFLRRYRKKYDDCYTETEAPRSNEPTYLYRTSDVLPVLEEHFDTKTKATKPELLLIDKRTTDGRTI